MKKPFVWTLVFGLLPTLASPVVAQETGVIAGTIRDATSAEPLSGAQIQVVGTSRGVLSTAEGRFIILDVTPGTHTVRAQRLGYQTAEQTVTVTAGGTAQVAFELRQQAIEVEGVVVTALGMEREKRSLGFAVQGVDEEVLDRTPEVNLVQALQGQTAGVQVIQSSGRPGASSRIEIRGQSTFTGSGQPLFIIDGVPVSADLDSNSGRGVLGYGQSGNRAMDFDMTNVEEITVLRGAAATALYGSRAASGAVVITTKKGTPGAPLQFEFSSSASFDDPIIEGYVTDWAAGEDRLFCNGRLESQGGYCQPGYPGGFETSTLSGSGYPNWGPHKDSIPAEVISAIGPVSFKDAREQYYQTAQSLENSLRVSGALGDRGAFTFGVSHLNQGDITPTGKLERLNLSANVNLTLRDGLRSATSIQKIDTHNPWPNDSWNGVHHALLHIPANVDISQAYLDDGSPVLWGSNTPHLQWVAENEYEDSNVDRWIVAQRFEFDVLPGFTLSNNWGLDTYVDYRRRYQNERPWRTAEGLSSGGTRQEELNRTSINNDLVLTMQGRQIGETPFTVSGLVGGNLWMERFTRLIGSGSDIVIPGYYNVENFTDQDVFAWLPEEQRLLGVYGQATLDYQDWAYLTITGRNDWSSTLPKDANNYFYPSASLGVVFTDALDWHPAWMPYGKVRVSYAKVGNDAPPYSLASVYESANAPGAHFGHYQFDPTTLSFPFRDQVGFLQDQQLGNPNIKPESTTETEVGLELAFLDRRASLDLSYYQKKSFDQIFRVPASASSGYTTIVRNAGDLRNNGIEVSLRAQPIRTDDFSWDVGVNWTRNRNEVVELAEGIDNLILAGYSWPSIRIMEGLPYGVIWGYGLQRNCVENTSDICFPDQPVGALLLGGPDCTSVRFNQQGDCYGLPMRTQQQIPLGSALPDWLGNLTTSLRYKGVGLSGLLDVRKGSKILNFELQYTTGRNGRHIFTNDRYTTEVLDGINVATGEKNDVEVFKDPTYYELMYGYDKHENQIEPGGFVKLRQLTLSYDLPASLLNYIRVQSGTLYVTGRNLAIWSDFSMLDPESDVYGGASGAGQYFRQFPAPQTRGFTVGLRTRF